MDTDDEKQSAFLAESSVFIRVHPWLKYFWPALASCWAGATLAAAPDIDSISPLALRPGIPTEITISGSGLSEASNVWANFPAKFEPVGDGHFRVTPGTNCPVGIGTIRLYGSNGVSPLSFVMLDDLPT